MKACDRSSVPVVLRLTRGKLMDMTGYVCFRSATAYNGM